TQPGVGLHASEAKQGERGRGPRDDRDVWGPSGGEPSTPIGVAGGGELHPSGSPSGVDRETREPGKAAPWDSDGSRPGGTSRDPQRVGADLRARLRSAELRVSSGEKRQGCPASSSSAPQSRLRPRGGCGFSELLRHDPSPAADGAGEKQGRGQQGLGPARSVSRAGGDGECETLDSRPGNPARSGDQPSAVQHLPGPAGPSHGATRLRDGAVRRRLCDLVPYTL